MAFHLTDSNAKVVYMISSLLQLTLQGRHFLAGNAATVAPTSVASAAAAAIFYSAKFRQGLGLGGLASCGSPERQSVI